jgi:heptosyltransferase-2
VTGGDKPRILVIRGGAIGDFILTLPAIKLLREAFPDAHLEILGYEHIVSVADGRFYADGTRSIEYGAMAGFFVPNGTLADDLAEYFASFQQVVSYLFDPDGIFEANLKRAGAKNVIAAYAKIDDSEHAARQLARPLQRLALYLEQHGAEIFPTEDDFKKASERLPDVRQRPLIAVHPGSGSARKNWPLAHWRQLLDSVLTSGTEPFIVFVGGEADRSQLIELRGQFPPESATLLEDLPLPELSAVLAMCSLFLGHDSGISHLAAAVQTKSVLLFGPTDPEIWAPANEQVSVLQAESGKLEDLKVEVVGEHVLPIVRALTPRR